MDPFVSTLLSSFFGALFGSALTLLTAWMVKRSEAKTVEINALNILLAEMHYRRSLIAITPLEVAIPGDDFEYAGRSVLSMRDLVRQTRLELRPKSDAFDLLGSMTSALNRYLDWTQGAPRSYQYALMALRTDLHKAAVGLTALDGGVKKLMPGDGAT